jgi:hypothetical protein
MLHRLHEWWTQTTQAAPPLAGDDWDLPTPPALDLTELTRWQADIERRVRYVETELATIRRRQRSRYGLRDRQSAGNRLD